MPRIAAKSSGHEMPIPSAAQKVPRLESSTPTTYFMRFSGTRVSGLPRAAPAAVTTSPATIPPPARPPRGHHGRAGGRIARPDRQPGRPAGPHPPQPRAGGGARGDRERPGTRRTRERGAPAARQPDRQDDGQSLDRFHARPQEGGAEDE